MALTIGTLSNSTSPTCGNRGKAGDLVAITATGLTSPATVNVAGATATLTVSGPTAGTFTVPAGVPCSGTAQVSVKLASGATSNSLPFSLLPAPTTAALSETILAASTGGSVDVFGTGFAAGGNVLVNGTAVTPGFSAGGSNTQIAGVAFPSQTFSGCTESLPVTVTTCGGTSTAGVTFITYQNAPTITPPPSPASGTTNDSITISGDCFDNLLSVTFTDTALPTPHTETAVIDYYVGGAGGFAVVFVPDNTLVAGPATITVTTPGGSDSTAFTLL